MLRDCKSARATCYKCQQKGHFANECPNPRVEATTSGTKPVDKGKAKVNAITEAQAAEADIITGTLAFTFISLCFSCLVLVNLYMLDT